MQVNFYNLEDYLRVSFQGHSQGWSQPKVGSTLPIKTEKDLYTLIITTVKYSIKAVSYKLTALIILFKYYYSREYF